MKISSIAAIVMFVLIIIPITVQAPVDVAEHQPSFSIAQSGLLPAHNYVWQEINGFCAWAATAMAMQYAGVDVNMHDVFAASTIGFSFAYFRFDDTLLIIPGAIYTQAEPTNFLAELYGVNYTIYLGDTIPNLEQTVQVWESEGLRVGVLDGQAAAFDLMRDTIDRGYPLLISVDPAYLPSPDYDILRAQGISGGAHGILIVGYNDTEGLATIVDPGVGSFGESFGYPIDGRGNYTQITYTALIDAWSNRYFISNTFFPGGTPITPIENTLGPMVRDKLLGVGHIYSPTSANALVGKFGQAAFRKMSEDITIDGLKSFLQQFDGVDDEINFKASMLYFIGIGLEAQVTLQYLSFRTALVSLPALMPDVNLTAFVEAGDVSLPAFDRITDNSSLIFPGNVSQATGMVATTFLDIAETFNATGDIDEALNPHQSTLNAISSDLLIIADSWRDAGNVLAEYWPNDFLTVYGPIILFAGGGVGALVIVLVYWIWKKESQ
ncbi:MAG: BtrH N-terminal domain-containing protein [Candidatus Thorarchaeota archaeon]